MNNQVSHDTWLFFNSTLPQLDLNALIKIDCYDGIMDIPSTIDQGITGSEANAKSSNPFNHLLNNNTAYHGLQATE